MNKKLKYNLASKIAGVLVYFLLCITLVVSVIGTYFCLSLDIYTNSSYQDSRLFTNACRMDLDNIQKLTISGSYLNETRYMSSNTNLLFAVYTIDFEQNESYLWGNIQEKKDNSYSFMAKGKMYNIYYDVDTAFPVKDGYYQNYQLFNFLVNFKSVFVCTLLVGFVLTIIDLIYLGSVVGLSSKTDKPTLSFIDKMPLEMVVVILALLIFAYSKLIVLFKISSLNPIISAAVMVLLIAVGFLILVLTICSRSKCGRWYENSFIYKIVSSLKDFYINLAILYKTVITTIICFVAIPLLIKTIFDDNISEIILLIYGVVLAILLCYQATKISKIITYTKRIVAGDYSSVISEQEFEGELRKYVKDLNCISSGMDQAVQQQLKSEKLKMELITNVSHDIKTPLTLILSYIDLLKNKHTASQGKQYVDSLEKAAIRLKKMTDDVLEVSKVNTGNVNVNLALTDINQLLSQAVGEYQDRFSLMQLETSLSINSEKCMLNTDGQIVWRILDNCFSNVCKYSVKNSRVYIQTDISDKYYLITIKNVSSSALNIDANTLMERFVRGDRSRNSEGSGLGLNISSSLTKLLNGDLKIIIDGDLFKVIICLPLEN